MIREIQIRDDPHTVQTVTLDGVTVRLATYTNKANGLWALDLADSDGVALVQGLALVTGLDLLFPYRHLDVPPGPLFVSWQSGAAADPGLTSFTDQDASLYYLEATA